MKTDINQNNKQIKLLLKPEIILDANLNIIEEGYSDDMVGLELNLENQKLSAVDQNLFSALNELRIQLEKQGIQIMCNGSAKNVYPSPMQLSMGVGRTAYRLFLGRQAKSEDIVDIFEYSEDSEFVSIYEQENYYKEWLNSL